MVIISECQPETPKQTESKQGNVLKLINIKTEQDSNERKLDGTNERI